VRIAFPLALAAAVAALAVSSAVAAIVPQQGIAGVKIAMTQSKVRSLLGKPASVRRGSNDFGKYTIFKYMGLQVEFQGNSTVTSVTTTRTAERTASGIGVGSTEAQVKAKIKGVRCAWDGGFRHCYLGEFRAGHRVTDFAIKRGKVSRVDLGVVLD
jgi:outer membrane protein assembly factor BamE (lipoprotein component of BamABCDE complex)